MNHATEGSLQWRWARLESLGGEEVYDLLALRSRVFVVEQQCIYLDADGVDRHAWHLLGRAADGVLVACLRAVDPGVKYAEPSLGRVITAPEVRGTGLGRVLVREGIARCARQWPGQANRISAQSRLERFYASLGWERTGPDYDEDGIPHCDMLRRSA